MWCMYVYVYIRYKNLEIRANALQCTANSIWSVISSCSILNWWSSSLGLFYHVPLKRDLGDWDWRLRWNETPNAIGYTMSARLWLFILVALRICICEYSNMMCIFKYDVHVCIHVYVYLCVYIYMYMHIWYHHVEICAPHYNAPRPQMGDFATHCNTLQHTATHCNTLQHTTMHQDLKLVTLHTGGVAGADIHLCVYDLHVCAWICIYTLLPSRIMWNALQHTATHCNTLQHTATHEYAYIRYYHLELCATHCNTLQRTATHCNTLQHTATHCNTLQHT